MREDILRAGEKIMPRPTVFQTGVRGKENDGKILYERLKKVKDPGVYCVFSSQADALYYDRDAAFDEASVYISEDAMVTALVCAIKENGDGEVSCPDLSSAEKRVVIYDLERLPLSDRRATLEEIAKLAFRWQKDNPKLQYFLLTGDLEQAGFFTDMGAVRVPDDF